MIDELKDIGKTPTEEEIANLDIDIERMTEQIAKTKPKNELAFVLGNYAFTLKYKEYPRFVLIKNITVVKISSEFGGSLNTFYDTKSLADTIDGMFEKTMRLSPIAKKQLEVVLK